jgi:hypothetical protein
MAPAAPDALGYAHYEWLLATSDRRAACDHAGGAAASVGQNTLAIELEAVTRLGLQKLDHILRLPTDPGNGNILRAQTTAAATAVNAQLRADEAKMKQVQKADFMPRLLEMIKIEEAKLAEMDRAKLEKEGRNNAAGAAQTATPVE